MIDAEVKVDCFAWHSLAPAILCARRPIPVIVCPHEEQSLPRAHTIARHSLLRDIPYRRTFPIAEHPSPHVEQSLETFTCIALFREAP